MRIKSNMLMSIMLVVLLIAITIPGFLFIQNNSISKSNRLKTKAKKEYLDKDFVSAYGSYKLLVDSLLVQNAAATLNYANSAYLSTELLTRGLEGGSNKSSATDSTLKQIGYYANEKYASLTSSTNAAIASMASNQLGYASLKGSDVFQNAGSDSVLFTALENFKNALRKDPQNDSARHNFELIKKIIDFPGTVLAETKALIAQKKYRQAARLLEQGMRRDPRLRQKQDFMDRLRTVITIDSLERGS
jgi:Ca-activated chloride channel homolog